MLENKKRAAPKVIRGKRRALFPRREPHYLVISRFSVLRRAKRQRDEWDPTPTYEFSRSLPNHRKQEENSLQFNKKEEGCSYTSWYRKGSGRAPTPATQKRGPSNFLRNVRELLTISSSSSTQGRELMIKKKGWSSFKLPALTEKSGPPCGLRREMRSPLPHPLEQEVNSIQVTLGERRQPLSRRELLHLLVSLHPNLKKTEESSLRVIMDRAPPVFKSTV